MAEKVYFPNLNALRFLSFIAVFITHSFWADVRSIRSEPAYQFVARYVGYGSYGVNFFFVLSGFLITYLLLLERAEFGRINLLGFYKRRILRIWPLYYLVVGIGFLAVPYVQRLLGQPTPEQATLWHYVLFISNFYSGPGPTSAVLGILWSVTIEEQFYLVWPVLLILTPVRWQFLLFPAVIAVSLLCRPFIPSSIVHGSPLYNMLDLAVGGWAAYLALYSQSFKAFFSQLKKPVISVIYLLGFLAVFNLPVNVMHPEQLTAVSYFSRPLFAVFFAFIILEQNFSQNSFYKAANLKTASALGAYTYGLYMFHIICTQIVTKGLDILKLNTNVYQVLFLQTGLSLLMSIAAAWISYHTLEAFFLKMKRAT